MKPTGNESTQNVRSADNPALLDDRRRMPRRPHRQRVAIVPVLLDSGPGDLQWADATTEDASATGISLLLDSKSPLKSRTCVVGADSPSGGRRFATMEIMSQTPVESGIRIGGRWVIGTPDDVLLSEKLRPRVDPRTLTFAFGYADETLRQWTELGVLRQYLMDRVLLCAECSSIPSWRHGCHVCGSGRIHRDRLVHHFACAHVERASEFETAGGLRCPKCRTSKLIVGADFEYIEGPVECFDCGAKGGQPTLSAMCHRCHRRFGMDEAEERQLFGYHVERLDPLAFYGS